MEPEHQSVSRSTQLAGWAARAALLRLGGPLLLAALAPLALVLACAMLGAAFQSSTLAWPIPLDDRGGRDYQAAGWSVSSRFGWRESPLRPGLVEFHDGVDLAGSPLCLGCPTTALFDATVRYVGWDDAGAAAPDRSGGGQIVVLENGGGAYEALYGHLQPYRLHVQLQGRIDDPHGRYDAYADYAPVGDGELVPAPDAGALSIWCSGDMPRFVAEQSGAGTYTFSYDRPADCRATVTWGWRGDDWEGWVPDDPPARDGRSATLSWRTPIDSGRRAGDVALRFRAHLVPPPPLPTATPTISETTARQVRPQDAPAATPRCEAEGGGTRCTWAIAAIPPATARASESPGRGGPLGAPLLAAPSATPQPLGVSISSSRAAAPPGGRVRLNVGVFGVSQQRVTVALDPALAALDVAAAHGSCSVAGQTVACTTSAAMGASTAIEIVADVRTGTPPQVRLLVTVAAEEGQARAADRLILLVDGVAVTPAPWPPPTPHPTATPVWPTAAPIWPTAVPIAPAPPQPQEPPSVCRPLALQQLPGVLNAHGTTRGMQLVDPAASSFQAVRAELFARVGRDPLARLADALRSPEFRSDKPGVALMSWHMTGRAVDLDHGFAWRIVPEGRMYRVFAGSVDVTAIFERHGWRRIPAQGAVAEWWHYEYRPEGVAWAGAMLQVWPIDRLRAAFPQLPWSSVGCGGAELLPWPEQPAGPACTPAAPRFAGPIEELAGCGPPLRPGDRVFQLDSVVGFVGLTGATTGPHLHLGLRARSYDGAYRLTNICTPRWLAGLEPPAGAECWTEMADPLDFLPRAMAGAELAPGTPIPEGAPYQLPPPDADSSGQYWSPNPDGGRYGGGDALAWLRSALCTIWPELCDGG